MRIKLKYHGVGGSTPIRLDKAAVTFHGCEVHVGQYGTVIVRYKSDDIIILYKTDKDLYILTNEEMHLPVMEIFFNTALKEVDC